MDKSFKQRLAALEALDAARAPTFPLFVCMHAADYAAYSDLATPAELRQSIAEAYQLGGDQKWYVAVCLCWGDERCRVCDDWPVVGEGTV